MNVKIKLQKVSTFYTKLVLKVSVFRALEKSCYWVQFSKQIILLVYFILRLVQWELFSRKYLEKFREEKTIKNVRHSHRHISVYVTL